MSGTWQNQLERDFPQYDPGFQRLSPRVRGSVQSLWAGIRSIFRAPRLTPGTEYPFRMADDPECEFEPDSLFGTYHAPEEDQQKPLLLLVHGLPGGRDSPYVRYTAEYFLGRGYPVLRVGLRGAGSENGKTRELYHGGRTDDLRRIIDDERTQQLAPNGIFVMGYSFGGNITFKLVCEEHLPESVRAAVSVSGSIDLAATNAFIKTLMWPGRIFGLGLLMLTKRQFSKGFLYRRKGDRSGHRVHLSKDESYRLTRARSFYRFDRDFFARFSGFDDVDDYYSTASAVSYAHRIAVPTLAIHSGDDPFVPVAPCRELPATFLHIKNGRNGTNSNLPTAARDLKANLFVALTNEGGHVGYWQRRNGRRRPSHPWYNMAAHVFFEKILGSDSRVGAGQTELRLTSVERADEVVNVAEPVSGD